jgi:2-C-methyl-D-erythritol 4-phosphate cytidylyltransferase
MDSKKKNLESVAVVLAGGVGQRVGADIPKQFINVAGKPIIIHTLEALNQISQISKILLVMHKESIPSFDSMLSKHSIDKLYKVIEGGSTRNGSTKNAIAELNRLVEVSGAAEVRESGETSEATESNGFGGASGVAIGANGAADVASALNGGGSNGVDAPNDLKVLFHDAVRPFVDGDIVQRCIEALDEFNAVDTCIASADTIVEIDKNEIIQDIPNRSLLRRGQTPQAFLLSTIRMAYEAAENDKNFSATDDCGVVLRYLPEVPVKVVEGSDENIKITESIDINIADKIFQMRTKEATPLSKSFLASKLSGKRVMILGGSYGIGKACEDLFSLVGARIASYSRQTTNTDICNVDSLLDALVDAKERLGGIDIIIVTAGRLDVMPISEMSADDIFKSLSINLIGPAEFARAAYPYLKDTKGHIIFFASSSYTRGRANYSLYSAAKAGIVNLTQALADEWSIDDISVNCISPQRTDTPMRRSAFGTEPEGSLLTPEKVALATATLAVSDLSGTVVDVTLK